MPLLKQFVQDETAQGITEYALILGLVVLGIWIAVSATNLGQEITNLFNRIKTEVQGCTSGSCP